MILLYLEGNARLFFRRQQARRLFKDVKENIANEDESKRGNCLYYFTVAEKKNSFI